jgi:hypothetical protein
MTIGLRGGIFSVESPCGDEKIVIPNGASSVEERIFSPLRPSRDNKIVIPTGAP